MSLPDDRLLFLVADASDQGAASTALALMVRVVLHSCPLSSGARRVPFCPFPTPAQQPPHILLGHLGRILAENKLPDQFMTAFCGILNPADGRFQFANAGHPYPRWWRASQGIVEAVQTGVGPPLGADCHAFYQPHAISLEPGDLLVLYSDSLTAVLNGNRRMSIQTLLDDALREAAPRGADSVKAAVLGRLDDFLAGEAYADEITLMIIERQREARALALG
jgi:sigma-B regulation protein RsbU (phosphoserine phosphatase)